MKTEVEMSGQTVWDCWAEGMEIMLGKRCLTGIKVKIIYEQHQHFFFPSKTCRLTVSLQNSIIFLLFLWAVLFEVG